MNLRANKFIKAKPRAMRRTVWFSDGLQTWWVGVLNGEVVTYKGYAWATRKEAIEDAVAFREKCREMVK